MSSSYAVNEVVKNLNVFPAHATTEWLRLSSLNFFDDHPGLQRRWRKLVPNILCVKKTLFKTGLIECYMKFSK